MESFELNVLQQGSLTVEEFYKKLRELMIRDGVIEPQVITRNRFMCGVRKEIAQLLPRWCKCLFTLLYHAKQIEVSLQEKEVENSTSISLSYVESSKELSKNVNMCEEECEDSEQEKLSDKEEENVKECLSENEEVELCFELCEKKEEGEDVENSITFVLSLLQVNGYDSKIDNLFESKMLFCQFQENLGSLTFFDAEIPFTQWKDYTFPFDRGKV